MIRAVCGYDEAVGAWVAARPADIGGAADFGPYTSLGIVRDGRIVAGVVYYDYRRTDMMMAVAATDPRWMSRSVLREIFAYPFTQMRCQRVTAVIDRRNKRARKLVEGLGFRMEGVLRKALKNNRDAILYGLLKDECQWIKPRRIKDGKEKRTKRAEPGQNG